MDNNREKPALTSIGTTSKHTFWIDDKTHRHWLRHESERQLRFFRKSLNPAGGFFQLDPEGNPIDGPQELFATTRMIHSFALAKAFGAEDCDEMIDHGMKFLLAQHKDHLHGGYYWSVSKGQAVNDRKLAYGHAFVLLAASSAKQAGHPEADQLLKDIDHILIERFWEADMGLFSDEANRDWSSLKPYRGFNANMHGAEALLAAFEATDYKPFLEYAGRIFDFFAYGVAKEHDERIPEHYHQDWSIDPDYEGNPMFQPAGSTPGHSFELARLLLQYWDLTGQQDDRALPQARRLVERALKDAWNEQNGGIAYTLKDGSVDKAMRYWWPVTEAIGVLAALIKIEHKQSDELWYRKLWAFAFEHFIDHHHGGWYPEIDVSGELTDKQFKGKPDIYHSLQAALLPLSKGISRPFEKRRV